ncbi:ribokinase [Shewanella baltica]|jgi:sugar/nucleoside kinase (ribokinase family)|uniref:PfkB family carbohydrate kinase n=1 Tax=Shewanella TaxID=22 RepID=UPI0009037E34|nr:MULTISPECIES: PfkB family carbohydrate kinase [Shewanella]MCB2382862.1 PfkB family carbohydrate kinase [Shewanella sp. SR1]MCS6114373.1 ribokinase [Shewanella baltica]MCS6129052.1 ribokinase [Shewanella baltica]MCS6140982.1 ribokinase [Shewanella baltica]MCS6147266.1 ribokinase [Shewanella baltica]
MANILLVANLNCDRILLLDKPLKTGGRFHYQDGGQRLGGGGANTGLGLVWAGHSVALVSQVGRDDMGDWLIAEASTQGLDCRLVQRRAGNTCEMLLVMTPDGERTIIRPQRPIFELSVPPKWQPWDALYFNTSAEGSVSWAKTALEHCLVVAQLAKDDRQRPCHILLASMSDIQGRCDGASWEYGKSIGGECLRYFIVTDGINGAKVYTHDQVQHVAAIPATVVDTTGAGDAYAAGLIHSLCTGQSITEAMAEGAVWAAFAVATDSSIPGEALKQYLEAKQIA